MLGRAALATLVVLLPRVLAAQTADAGAPPPAPAEGAREEAAGEAAQRATQELEVRVIELQRALDAMERERASFDDLRRRLDELEARDAASRRGAPGDWMSFPGGQDGLREKVTGLADG